jgi:L,D-transpeptidase catalytic domain
VRGFEASRFRPRRYLIVAVVLMAAAIIGLHGVRASESSADVRSASAIPQSAASDSPPERVWFPGAASPGRGRDRRIIRSLLNIRKPMTFGDSVWNDAGVPSGPLWVRVDLKRQVISLFRGGNEIATAVIIYGAQNKPSPTGSFRVLVKDEDYRSATYDAAMPYALFLTHDGVAIHASDVRYRNATHGCIGVPIEFARRLFETVRVGDPVDIIATS